MKEEGSVGRKDLSSPYVWSKKVRKTKSLHGEPLYYYKTLTGIPGRFVNVAKGKYYVYCRCHIP